MRYVIYFLCAMALLPLSAHAAVIINEIAWMGTAVSANDEWVELHNTGTEPVPLAGWVLRAEDGAPTVSLSGTLDAGGYFLLERTDDESVPGITADAIYSGVLSNETENLSLLDAGGVEVDVVRSGSGWSLGGDNTTKHTAQRQADGRWITGVPTPRAQNSTEDTKNTGDNTGTVSGTSTQATAKKKTTGGYKQVVYAYAGEDTESVSGAYAFFKAFGVDDTNNSLTGVRYRWTFGDGSVSKVRTPRHIYHFPGTYMAALHVTDGEQDAKDSVLVRVSAADVAIADVGAGEDGYITLHNKSTSALDLSLWTLRAHYTRDGKKRTKTFTIPLGTMMAPETATPFPAVITRIVLLDTDSVELVLPNGRVTASWH